MYFSQIFSDGEEDDELIDEDDYDDDEEDDDEDEDFDEGMATFFTIFDNSRSHFSFMGSRKGTGEIHGCVSDWTNDCKSRMSKLVKAVKLATALKNVS